MTAIAEGLTLEDTALAELTAGLRGEVIGRDDPTYDEARKIWNGSIDKRPALIARCAGVADVDVRGEVRAPARSAASPSAAAATASQACRLRTTRL